MSLYNKELESISEQDLQSLVEDKVLEKKNMEYKALLPGNSDGDKKEFLADVTSFANASGGDIIFGIKEERGFPKEIRGLDGANVDAVKQRLENMIRTGVGPRMPNVSIHPVPLSNSRVVIMVRTPKSWALPHMVTFKRHSRFYSRNSAGKYPLDVSEIRGLFVLSETAAERIRNFRVERMAKIVADETPVPLRDTAKLVLHVVPWNAFGAGTRLDLSCLDTEGDPINPIFASSCHSRYNFDGFLRHQIYEENPCESYLQIFRNGSIEAVETYLLNGGKGVISSQAYEREILEALPRFFSAQKKLGVQPPLFVMLSLLGVLGHKMAVRNSFFGGDEYGPHSIDRDSLLVPEVLVDSFDCDIGKIMKAAFDAVWNAAGYPESRNYNSDGKWVGQG